MEQSSLISGCQSLKFLNKFVKEYLTRCWHYCFGGGGGGGGDNQKRMRWWKLCAPKCKGGMGVRDMHCFNLALLAKQAWRLIDNPDSLCGTVPKAKYFPNGDLLNAKLKKRELPS